MMTGRLVEGVGVGVGVGGAGEEAEAEGAVGEEAGAGAVAVAPAVADWSVSWRSMGDLPSLLLMESQPRVQVEMSSSRGTDRTTRLRVPMELASASSAVLPAQGTRSAGVPASVPSVFCMLLRCRQSNRQPTEIFS